ncbi:hypothetical protein GCM10017673_27580 [Streptosporangium violaceochromogenes]|nr:hypothetical protein GCM10017673_27580 [Streptosporangium violaceochromogenes]
MTRGFFFALESVGSRARPGETEGRPQVSEDSPTITFRGTRAAIASAASRATSGMIDVYVSDVIVIDECRNIA